MSITKRNLPPEMTLGDIDFHLFAEGTHGHLYEKLGAHPIADEGTQFAVWAPNADYVSVVGDFNGWDPEQHRLGPTGDTGIWQGFVEQAKPGALYKYHIRSRYGGYRVNKADPFGIEHETPPRTASRVRRIEYAWGDQAWMSERSRYNALEAPMSVYEVHLGSWKRPGNDPNGFLTYRDLAQPLAEHARSLGYTHIELMPIMEHPFYGSWGYQVTGYFAPTSRYGSPEDFMHFVDVMHQHGLGVILDWVPAHYPNDEHGLVYFDGTHLFEHEDPRQGFHPDWNTHIFNFGRHEVRSFLISSALFWLDRYHIDGLRVDAVASMLYLNYSRKEGEWIPNKYGGNENLDAIDFLRKANERIYGEFPHVQTIAEESTAWPMVSRPNYLGGLGFGLKWDMGWMHDTLKYIERDPIYRKHHHGELSFRAVYAFNENFVLPLSHDEVVHGKGSLLGKMPGDDWQRFANLRVLYAYMYAQPGKKLLFMGSEFAQSAEWNHEHSLDWHLLEHESHQGIQRLVRELNRVYRDEPALHELDCSHEGFEWIDFHDAERSVLAFVRKAKNPSDRIVAAFNFTPVPQHNYRLGVDRDGYWEEIMNTDAEEFWGSGQGNMGGAEAAPVPSHGRRYSLSLTLPPLGAVFLRSPR